MDKSTKEPQKIGRRKAIKTVLGGITAVTAYHCLPTMWRTPVVESIFLPAHAATSAPVSPTPVVYTITSGTFNLQEALSGQTNFFGATGTVASSNGVIPAGAEIVLRITMSPGGTIFLANSMTVANDGSFNFSAGIQQFLATGNTSATGTFSFIDQSTYGNSTLTYTDNDLTM